MFHQILDKLWLVIGLLFQLVLAAVLIALIMGDAAGSVVMTVYGNVKDLLGLLNPSAVAVVAVLYLFWHLNRKRFA
jgi:hypothetical protein